MKLTQSTVTDINRRIRDMVTDHTRIRAEVGHRPNSADRDSGNALTWTEGADLSELWPLKAGMVIEDSAEYPGLATLDLYVYGTIRDGGMYDGEHTLICNVYAYLRDGRIVDMHDDNLRADTHAQIIGFPHFSK